LALQLASASLLTAVPAVLAAQPAGSDDRPPLPWAIQISTERAAAGQNGFASPWIVDRFGVTWVRPETGGLFTGVERHTRHSLSDVTAYFRGYHRAGDWTFLGGAGVTPAADFQYRSSVEAEVSRRLAGSLVGSAGYRFLAFRRDPVHLFQPGLTWYHSRGELQGRLLLSRSRATSGTSATVLVHNLYDIKARLRAGAGVAYGDRVFDALSLPSGSAARARLAFGHLRIGLTQRDAIEVGASFAHEEPSFGYRSLSVGYRRAF
jgi:YaiO family outer membrane protein